MEMTMSQIEKIAIQIANDLKQIKTRRVRALRKHSLSEQNRFAVTMVEIEKLEANMTRHLKQIEKIREEREDKICGICYDCEATCKLDCVHKLCEKCYPKMDSCPFCRKKKHTYGKTTT